MGSVDPIDGKDTTAPKADKAATIYVTKTGTKYHCEGCQFLTKSKIPIDLKETREKCQPCSVCNPPK